MLSNISVTCGTFGIKTSEKQETKDYTVKSGKQNRDKDTKINLLV